MIAVLKSHVGDAVHVEICGRTVFRIDAGGKNAFLASLPTQQELDAEFAAGRLTIRICALLCFIALLCGLSFRWFSRRAMNRPIHPVV
ncbi:hypothetical protein D0B32_04855 [Paraburkholderia sp. DHOC27]|nr:hypothetical protein D0B32_04855 [Paraburkholderia sp. DHOC27]